MYFFLNMCNLCRYAWFLQAQSHILYNNTQLLPAIIMKYIFSFSILNVVTSDYTATISKITHGKSYIVKPSISGQCRTQGCA